jgi:hypothetical protein
MISDILPVVQLRVLRGAATALYQRRDSLGQSVHVTNRMVEDDVMS